jgi:hypothetical protein
VRDDDDADVFYEREEEGRGGGEGGWRGRE